jgi:transcriptional regulator with XRE-family HTH domain
MSDNIGFLRKDVTSVPEVRSPTVRRRELGALLRALRLKKSLTVEQAAEQLLFSMSKLSRMETGQGVPTARDLRDLWALYGVTDGAERDRMTKLATEGKELGWWDSRDLNSTYGTLGKYLGLEAAATGLLYYQSAIVPGLLQTAGYARAIHEAYIPKLAAESVDELVDVRMTRQRRLTQAPLLSISVVMDEAALHRVVGGLAVMRAQLARLVEMARMPNVSLQVIPFSAGAHPAMDCTFRILKFASSMPEVVYVEALSGGLFLERPEQMSVYSETFEHVCASALDPEESIRLIERVGRGYAAE